MRRRPTSWWAKWISSTNPSSPSSAWLKPRRWEVWPRCPFPPGKNKNQRGLPASSNQKNPLAIQITWPHMFSYLPRRFLFILLGPQGKAKSYNEIGRAIATLMVDDVSVRDVPSWHADNDSARGVWFVPLTRWDPPLLCFNYIWKWGWLWSISWEQDCRRDNKSPVVLLTGVLFWLLSVTSSCFNCLQRHWA